MSSVFLLNFDKTKIFYTRYNKRTKTVNFTKSTKFWIIFNKNDKKFEKLVKFAKIRIKFPILCNNRKWLDIFDRLEI